MSNLTAAGYIVSDNEAIWGYGKTADEAWADMLEFVQSGGDRVVDELEPDTLGDFPNQVLASNFHITAATQALLDAVETKGGAIAWRHVGAVSCTDDEV